jgi:uncharacterized protein YutE (UPF0331/DUF86 family)
VVDPDRVRQLLDALSGYRAELRELAKLPAARYRGRDAIAGRYLVQAAAQACIDLANHVIASSGWRVPKDYADAFAVLEENGILATELADRLRDLARLRNLLVHAYGEVDDEIIHRSLDAGLADLDEFARLIAGLVAGGG